MKLIRLLLLSFLSINSFIAYGQRTSIDKINLDGSFISDENLVNTFYKLNQFKLFWFVPGGNFRNLRIQLRTILDSCENTGLQKANYHYADIKKNAEVDFTDSISAMRTDRIFTDAAISYAKDIYQGMNINKWISYDEISKQFEDQDNIFLLRSLISTGSSGEMTKFFNSLEPKDSEYVVLKYELSKISTNKLKKNQLET